MRRVLPALALVLLPALAPSSATAQAASVPKRPKLEAALVDSNDARVYYDLGLKLLTTYPADAADAFWWASRLDPAWADPIYAQRVARLMASTPMVEALMTENRRMLQTPEMQQLDSLQLRALSINPFLHRKLDALMLRAYLFKINKPALDRYRMQRNARAQDDFSIEDTDLDRWIDEMFKNSSGRLRAWYAFSQNRFADAVHHYESALGSARDKAEIRSDLARAFFLMGDRKHALEQLSLTIDELRRADAEQLVRVYESKAVYEHAIGLVHEMDNAPDSAKAAYQRALQEDLAYWPAHRQLGLLLLSRGDTANAIVELDAAVQLNDADPALHYSLGYVLTSANQLDEAAKELRRTIELDPEYAAPYALLGRIYDAAGYAPQATQYYRGFLAHAAKRDPQLQWTTQRVRTLAAATPDSTHAP